MSSFFAETHVAAAIFIAALPVMPHAVTTMEQFYLNMPPCRSHLPICSAASTSAMLRDTLCAEWVCENTHGCVLRGRAWRRRADLPRTPSLPKTWLRTCVTTEYLHFDGRWRRRGNSVPLHTIEKNEYRFGAASFVFVHVDKNLVVESYTSLEPLQDAVGRNGGTASSHVSQ